jgi:mRNA interferase RelE/StbE
MTNRVHFLPSVAKTLEKFDKYTQKILIGWIRKNLEDCQDPRVHGKPLASNRVSVWRYRVGDYRIIAKIEDAKLIILVIAIGHRRDIYK